MREMLSTRGPRALTALSFALALGAALPALGQTAPLPEPSAPAATPPQELPPPGPPDPYKQHMSEGVRLFQAQSFGAAIAAFEAAYKERPKASPLINLSLCHRAQKQYAKAIAALDLALAKHADSMEASDKAAAGAAIGEMRIEIGYLAVSTEPLGAIVTIDGVDRPKETAGRPVPLEPGHHRVGASMNGYEPSEEDVEVKAGGGEKAVSLTLTPTGPDSTRRWPLLITGVTLGGLGILGAAVGGFMVGAKTCVGAAANADAATCDLGKQRGTGGLLIGAGVVFLGVGIPLTLIGMKKVPIARPKAAWSRPEVFVGPANATVRWAF
jgi:hypothetical protein